MILRFNADDVRKLLDHARAAPKHRTLYDRATGPGLWLVGDQGVYLMSNGDPHFARPDGREGNFVVYAEGINPGMDAFDSWWDAKRASFGGDDGCEFLSLDEVEVCLGRTWLALDVTPQQIGVLTAKAADAA